MVSIISINLNGKMLFENKFAGIFKKNLSPKAYPGFLLVGGGGAYKNL